ncbi:MAG: protein translocase subunit SecF [Proteobacteria bacterium]|nr:protein translocase subunit SecF [Pseudomonadota bacterium]
MLELIKPGTKYDFIGWRKKAYVISGLAVGISIIAVLVMGGPPQGVDFRGGTEIQIAFAQPVPIEKLRANLDKTGISGISVQRFGEKNKEEYLIGFPAVGQDASARVLDSLRSEFGEKTLELKREEAVGPRVGKELRQKGLLATIIALLGILIYVAWRFEFRYGAGAVIALLHDLIIAYGFMTIFRYELSLTSLASLLTLAGYSVNDTIVIFDRMRENLRKQSRLRFDEIINLSINETLSRSIITNGATYLTILAIFFFGGPVLKDFSFVLLIGGIAGTYSTVYIASPILLLWKQKFGKKKK